MSIFSRTCFPRFALLVCALFLAGNAWAASAYDRIVAFGDSLSDPGNAFVLLHEVAVAPYAAIPDAPYARGGLRFSNGATWVEQLAKSLNLKRSAGPALATPGVFSNYAIGGARARAIGPVHLSTQVDRFLADFAGFAPADALYVVWAGGDDLRDAVEAFAFDPSGVTSYGILNDAVAAIVANIAQLHAAGARVFLVPNGPNLALVPAILAQGMGAQIVGQMLSVAFNDMLAAALTTLEGQLAGETIYRFDVFTLMNQTVAAPAAAGVTEVAIPCITPDTRVGAVCNRPDDYLFWDAIHPTRVGHAILANHAQTVLLAP